MARGRRGRGPAERYGGAGEGGAWKVAYDAYYWDRLEEAYKAASELGAGQWAHGLVGYRMIEGEWLTRERGVVTRVSDWLQVEVIPEELQGNPPSREAPGWLTERIVAACDEVAALFGFEHGPQVMVSVLSEESNVPWMPGRHGFCIDKHPYEKIVVPAYSVRDEDDLRHVVSHEYAHVVTLNLSGGRVPRWLDEAVAMVAGGGAERRAWRLLESGRAAWREAEGLERAYLGDREDDVERQDVWMAYQQSAVLGLYLASLAGGPGLGRMLRGHADNSVLREVLLRLRGLGTTDAAIRREYGFGVRELFARAFSWLKAQ